MNYVTFIVPEFNGINTARLVHQLVLLKKLGGKVKGFWMLAL